MTTAIEVVFHFNPECEAPFKEERIRGKLKNICDGEKVPLHISRKECSNN